MAGSSWLASALAAVMIMIAVYCASRLAISRLRRQQTEFDADGVHVVMGVAMAGMFLPRLSPLSDRAWEAVFGIAAAWFAWQAIRSRRGNARAGWLCSHPVPHLVECIAMAYMFLAVPGSRPAGSAQGMSMPGMGGSSGVFGNLPALAAVLALFMVGYVVWAADQLTSLARSRSAVTTGSPRYDPAGIQHRDTAGRPILAPGFAACSKIAMGATMGYMLILMI